MPKIRERVSQPLLPNYPQNTHKITIIPFSITILYILLSLSLSVLLSFHLNLHQKSSFFWWNFHFNPSISFYLEFSSSLRAFDDVLPFENVLPLLAGDLGGVGDRIHLRFRRLRPWISQAQGYFSYGSSKRWVWWQKAFHRCSTAVLSVLWIFRFVILIFNFRVSSSFFLGGLIVMWVWDWDLIFGLVCFLVYLMKNFILFLVIWRELYIFFFFFSLMLRSVP